nr:unnamed protein product [Callosobruchus analis]
MRDRLLEKRKAQWLTTKVCGINSNPSPLYKNEDQPGRFKKARELKTKRYKFVWCKNRQIYARKNDEESLIKLNSINQVTTVSLNSTNLQMANLRTACINLRSLCPKVNVIRPLLQSEGISILCLTETWLNSKIHDEMVIIEGYMLFRIDRDGRGGEVAVYVKNEIDVIFDRDSLKVDALENIWLSANVSNVRINIADRSLSALDQLISCNLPNCDEIILMGDMNRSDKGKYAIRREKEGYLSYIQKSKCTRKLWRKLEQFNVYKRNSNKIPDNLKQLCYGRKQYVTIDDMKSASLSLKKGVSQGSILGHCYL